MFTLTIETDNAAFEGPDAIYEVRRILSELGAGQWSGERELAVRDINGNTVGRATFVPDEEGDDQN